MQRSFSASASNIERKWYVIDASEQPLGRLASRVASVLRGKHRPEFSTHADAGDFVIVTNAEKIKLTGRKREDKIYYRHSGTPGGLSAEPYVHLMERRPELVIEKAVRGMLPKTTLGRQMGSKLKVYAGSEHPHSAQQPEPFPF